ncbi:MAG: SDR family oxidoreductase [Gammaproteobacteria bacterium]|nr:SDR family oxidoreductase [Gammaproteobacteria bacterium]
MPEQNLAGRHALVCGASRGIGRAIAQMFAARGANVTLLARNAEILSDIRDALPVASGARHSALAADLEDTSTLAQQLESVNRPVHILVNNAGGPPGGSVLDAAPEAFRKGFERLLIAAHLLAQECIPGMREAGYGRIINILSTSVREPIPGLGVSNTLRAACAAWAKTLSREVAADGITVNNVLPGFTATDRLSELFKTRAEKAGKTIADIEAATRAQVPAARFARPEETAAAAAFLASPEAGYITGVSLPVDGGRLHSI